MLDLAKELAPWKPGRFSPVPMSLVFSDETPAHRFISVIAPILDSDYFVVVKSRDYFNDTLAQSVVQFVSSHEPPITLRKPLAILESFDCPGFSFDAIAVLNPDAANQFEHVNDKLNRLTFVAFPIYRCELSGDETAPEIDLIRHETLPSLDWRREPCPKVAMSFRNTATKAHSELILSNMRTVLSELSNLRGVEASWLTIENFRGRRCDVAWTSGRYTARFPDQDVMPYDEATLIERMRQFATYDRC